MHDQDALPRLYRDLAAWWPLLSAPKDYAAEAAYVQQLLALVCDPAPRTLLELGSGGGNSASHLKAHYAMTLVDLSAEMLTVSRALNPECEHIQGDMRSLRLERAFDAVFLHDAVMYMTSQSDLRRALATAYAHCRPGGALILAPDCCRETFRPHTQHGGHDGDGRGLRYLEWVYDPDPGDTTYCVEFAYMFRQGAQVWVEHERHLFGLFAHDEWLNALSAVGFRPKSVDDPFARQLFIGLKAPHA